MINNKNNKETAPANPLPESKSASTRAPCEDVFAPPNPRLSLGLGRLVGSAGLTKTIRAAREEVFAFGENRCLSPLCARVSFFDNHRRAVCYPSAGLAV